MKKILPLISLLFLSYFLAAQEAPEGLFLNSKAPDFKAKDQAGNEVRLKDLLKKTKVVLVFYRGNWSIECTKFLKKLQDSLQFLKDKGSQTLRKIHEAKLKLGNGGGRVVQ